MMRSIVRSSGSVLALGAVLAIGVGIAWATSHELPSPPELLPTQPAPGWQEFVLYREALRWLGGVILGTMVLLVLCHFAFYGSHHVRPTGRLVRRYVLTEVLLHALLAVAFVGAWASSTYLILAKYVLGYAEKEFPVPLGGLLNTVHITAGLLFLGALLALAVMWWRGMRFAPYDRDWLKELGGYFSRRHRILRAGHFNAGQKIWFRASVLLGILVAVSGALIYYPGLLGPRWDIVLYMAHTALGVVLSAGVIVHVYLSVLVHPHAFRAVVTGHIDEACLREDYPLEAIPDAEKQAEQDIDPQTELHDIRRN